MPLLEIPVPNLLGGTSQQPPAQRAPGQVSACDNAALHVVNGLGKRQGSRHIAKLVDGLESARLVHFVDRDPAERYVMLVGERRLRVFSAADGTEYPVKVNGTATNAGRGLAGSGTPLNYLDPRTPGGVVDQDEDFVIGAGDWQTTVANSVTSYVTGRGPFNFGRRQSLTSVTADTVAEVGNGAAASVSDIWQDFGELSRAQVFSVYAKKSPNFACNDFELTIIDTGGVDEAYGARFDIDSNGVITVGAIVGPTGTFPPSADWSSYQHATVEDVGNGWYRCSVFLAYDQIDLLSDALLGIVGEPARVQVRFHTNAASPADKRILLFGGRLHHLEARVAATPDYVYPQPDLFRALTIADTTLFLNTEVTAAMDDVEGLSVDPARGFIVITRAIGSTTTAPRWTATIRYLLAAVPTVKTFTFTTTLASPRTDEDVAEGLRALIDADADLVATRNGNVIRVVTQATGATEQIRAVEVEDSQGNTMMVGIGSGVVNSEFFQVFTRRFTDLPLTMDSDMIIGITGDPERSADDYYVRFEGNATGSLVGGYWVESTRAGYHQDAGILTTLDAATMPQQVRRLQDDATGTITGVPNSIYFDVSPITWDQRLVGDERSNPEPSFVGAKIKDLFLYRGRLGFLADDNVVLSEAGEVFNFWRTTVLELVDTDPIDLSSGARESTTFRNAAATADSLLVFSDRRQFQVLGDPTLTPSSAQLAPVRSFESLLQCRPEDTGRGVAFARSDNAFSGLMEAALLRDDVQFRFDDLTVQAPRYIPGKALSLSHSSLVGLLIARSDANLADLYVHQSFHDDQENRLQSAVHRWRFDADCQVQGAGFFEAELLLVSERAQGWFLETLNTNTEILEESSGLPITLLDRRVDQGQVLLTYSGGPDETEITLPYEISETATMRVVDASTGLIVPIIDQGADSVTVLGDVTESDLFVGEVYEMAVTLSEPVIQDQSPRGGIVPRMGRPIHVNRLYLYLAETAFLQVEVAPDLRTPTTEEFTAAGLGTGLMLQGELTTFTGDAEFAMIGLSSELDVTLRNATPFPSYVQSARWEVVHRQRSGIA